MICAHDITVFIDVEFPYLLTDHQIYRPVEIVLIVQFFPRIEKIGKNLLKITPHRDQIQEQEQLELAPLLFLKTNVLIQYNE